MTHQYSLNPLWPKGTNNQLKLYQGQVYREEVKPSGRPACGFHSGWHLCTTTSLWHLMAKLRLCGIEHGRARSSHHYWLGRVSYRCKRGRWSKSTPIRLDCSHVKGLWFNSFVCLHEAHENYESLLLAIVAAMHGGGPVQKLALFFLYKNISLPCWF